MKRAPRVNKMWADRKISHFQIVDAEVPRESYWRVSLDYHYCCPFSIIVDNNAALLFA